MVGKLIRDGTVIGSVEMDILQPNRYIVQIGSVDDLVFESAIELRKFLYFMGCVIQW